MTTKDFEIGDKVYFVDGVEVAGSIKPDGALHPGFVRALMPNTIQVEFVGGSRKLDDQGTVTLLGVDRNAAFTADELLARLLAVDDPELHVAMAAALGRTNEDEMKPLVMQAVFEKSKLQIQTGLNRNGKGKYHRLRI